MKINYNKYLVATIFSVSTLVPVFAFAESEHVNVNANLNLNGGEVNNHLRIGSGPGNIEDMRNNGQMRGQGRPDSERDNDGSGMIRGNMRTNMSGGTITAINGNIITVSQNQGKNSTTTKTIAIDATNAIILNNRATSTISALVVGNTLIAEGTTTGSTFVATKISTGMMFKGSVNEHNGSSTDENIQIGFFGRIKSFFSHLFGR